MNPRRIEALADGIFAIVMTLLVLDIKVPQNIPTTSLLGSWPVIHALLPNYIGYVASFIILGVYWGAHHILFTKVKESTFNFMWLNLFFLLSVTFIPFSTSFLAAYPLNGLAQALYAADLIFAGAMMYGLLHYAVRRRNLVQDSVSQEFWVNATGKILLPPIVYFIALLASFWSAKACLALLVVGPLIYFVPIDSGLWHWLSGREHRLGR